MLTNGIILAISKCGTLTPLGIQFRPFTNNVCDTKYHDRGNMRIRESKHTLSGPHKAQQDACTIGCYGHFANEAIGANFLVLAINDKGNQTLSVLAKVWIGSHYILVAKHFHVEYMGQQLMY